MLRRLRVVVPLLVVSLLMSACAAGGGGDDDSGGSGEAKGTITVTSLWGGVEQEAFQKMLDAFKAKTGITANYESQRTDYATVLRTRISGGNAPDVAIMPASASCAASWPTARSRPSRTSAWTGPPPRPPSPPARCPRP